MEWLAPARVVALALLTVAACAPEETPARVDPARAACAPTAGATTGDLPCDVGQVLRDRCQACHQQPRRHGAPFALLSYEDTQAPNGTAGLLRWEKMAELTALPVGAPEHMPYIDPSDGGYRAPQLSDMQLGTLQAWFAACAPPVPEGTGCDWDMGPTPIDLVAAPVDAGVTHD